MYLSRTANPTLLCLIAVTLDGEVIEAAAVRALDTEAGWVDLIARPLTLVDGVPATYRRTGAVALIWTHRVGLNDGSVVMPDQPVTDESVRAFTLRQDGD